MSMARAIQFLAPGEVKLVEVDTADPSPTQALVRMLASSCCNYPELRSFRGGSADEYGSKYPMAPGEPGHEGVGVVESIGAEVQGVAVGDVVVMTGHGGDPTHRSHLLREADTLGVIHPGERDPSAASILEMFGCAYHCVRVGWREQGGFDDARVAVIGVGAIGLCSVQLLRLWPAAEVVAFDTQAEKLALAERMGATGTVLVPTDDDAAAVAKEAGEFDIVAECSGHPSGHRLANAIARRAVINVSRCRQPFEVNQDRWFVRQTTIYNPGVLGSVELKAVANLYNRGLLDPEPMISRRIAPEVDQYVETIEAIGRGEIVKALIQWSDA